MLDIIFTACLLANPDVCETKRIPTELEGNPWYCIASAQATIVEYLQNHKEYGVIRYGCAVHKEDSS